MQPVCVRYLTLLKRTCCAFQVHLCILFLYFSHTAGAAAPLPLSETQIGSFSIILLTDLQYQLKALAEVHWCDQSKIN